MREFCLISPFQVVLGALVVIVVRSRGAVLELLLEVKFLSLGEPGSCGLSPPVVVFEEAIVQMAVEAFSALDLVETFGDVALVLQVFRSDLSNM
jgi:hypothetical protein